MLYTVPYHVKVPDTALRVDTTSRSKNEVTRQLSPFYLGPCTLYGGHIAQTVESAWQYSKVYPEHIGEDGNPTTEYYAWAKAGWEFSKACRYPMGKEAKAAYTWWDGERLDYVTARRRVYVPLYAKAVVKTKAFQFLRLAKDNPSRDIYLADFDGYNHKVLGLTYDDVLLSPRRMGHAMVIAMLLDGYLDLVTGEPKVEPVLRVLPKSENMFDLIESL